MLTFAGFDCHRSNFALELAILCGFLRARERFECIGVLLFAGELVFGCDHIGEISHRAASIGVGQAIKRHVIFSAHIAIFMAGANVEQVRGIGHAFHAACDDDIGFACQNGVAAHNGSLQA